MTSSASLAGVYTDFQGLSQLKAKAAKDADAALDEVARQFESLLLQQMLKSMREASGGEGLMESDQSRFYREMFDQQLAIHLADNGGIGLSKMIQRQLGGNPVNPTPKGLDDYRIEANYPSLSQSELSAVRKHRGQEESDSRSWSATEFVQKLWPWAREAAAKIGLAPHALIAQSALETGWGKHLMQMADGRSSHNLFGIKADKNWDGDRVAVGTIEYEQNVAVRKKAWFRAYDSFRESFNDYVNFLQTNPRYRQALSAVHDSERYFHELSNAGYATDPQYAEKISAVLNGPQMKHALQQLKELDPLSL